MTSHTGPEHPHAALVAATPAALVAATPAALVAAPSAGCAVLEVVSGSDTEDDLDTEPDTETDGLSKDDHVRLARRCQWRRMIASSRADPDEMRVDHRAEMHRVRMQVDHRASRLYDESAPSKVDLARRALYGLDYALGKATELAAELAAELALAEKAVDVFLDTHFHRDETPTTRHEAQLDLLYAVKRAAKRDAKSAAKRVAKCKAEIVAKQDAFYAAEREAELDLERARELAAMRREAKRAEKSGAADSDAHT